MIDPPASRLRIPADFGKLVKSARRERGWTQARLAKAVDVSRETISRLEIGCTEDADVRSRVMPSPQLVRALLRDEALGKQLPLIRTELADPDQPDRGYRAYAARRAAGLTLVVAARAAETSPASLSLFEHSRATPNAIVGPTDEDDGASVIHDGYAKALGFDDATDMSRYIDSDDPQPWLERIAKTQQRPLPPLSRLPTRRVVPHDTRDVPVD
jgi:transcriptional regulator with XRE-family HTH domain